MPQTHLISVPNPDIFVKISFHDRLPKLTAPQPPRSPGNLHPLWNDGYLHKNDDADFENMDGQILKKEVCFQHI